jgi:3-hydroxybutyryl-CoA dehydrogenase
MNADAHAADAAPLPAAAGVVGGGTMGSGIVHVLLAAGIDTVLVEVDDASLARGVELVRESLDDSARRGKLEVGVDDALARLTASTRYEDLAACEVVIEAVPENPELKKHVLSSIERQIPDTALLATNTSSLSLGSLAGSLAHPERFVGMHFFNPVPAQPLLEIVRTPHADEEALRRAHALGGALQKESIEVNDSPGFATSRLGVLVGLEAVRMVEEGVASPEDIDKAMVLGYRYPIGPCRLGDLVGHDVRLGIAEYLYEELGERFEPPALLRQMVAEGKLGKKSGQGFFPW